MISDPPDISTHPGRIELYDGDSGQLIRQLDARELGASQAFALTPLGWIPVVRVVRSVRDRLATFQELGPNGKVLRTSYAPVIAPT